MRATVICKSRTNLRGQFDPVSPWFILGLVSSPDIKLELQYQVCISCGGVDLNFHQKLVSYAHNIHAMIAPYTNLARPVVTVSWGSQPDKAVGEFSFPAVYTALSSLIKPSSREEAVWLVPLGFSMSCDLSMYTLSDDTIRFYFGSLFWGAFLTPLSQEKVSHNGTGNFIWQPIASGRHIIFCVG